jgi:hypothetical protein
MLRSSCIYTRTFETACAHLPTDGPFVSPPPPYVINFEFAEAGLDLKARDRFRFGLRVFGDVTAYVPYFLVAFFRLGESGIGRDLTPFRILTIHALGPDDEREEIFRWGEPIRRPRVADLPYQTEPHPLRGVIVYLHTPTRIKKDRGFVDEKEIGLVDLVHAAERRIALLQRFYDPDRTLLPLDRSTLAGIRIESRDLDWQAWSRTSTRSGPMVWPGVVGKLELSGPVSEVARLLRAASKTNIGSKAAFGLGAIEVRPVE